MFTVLIADDEAIELKYLSSIFDKHPEQCRLIGQAENGEQAVAMAAHHRPDVIIMDISMPLLNGLGGGAPHTPAGAGANHHPQQRPHRV